MRLPALALTLVWIASAGLSPHAFAAGDDDTAAEPSAQAAPDDAGTPDEASAPAPKHAAKKHADEAKPSDSDGWIQKLDEAKARLAAAKADVSRYEAVQSHASARRYPSGEPKEKFLSDLENARKELDEAQREFPRLLEEARRAGVDPGVLRRYEEPDES